jgi:hypothetical protein
MEVAKNHNGKSAIVVAHQYSRLPAPPLGWSGIIVEHHIAQPGERSETKSSMPIVQIASGQYLARGERANWQGDTRHT